MHNSTEPWTQSGQKPKVVSVLKRVHLLQTTGVNVKVTCMQPVTIHGSEVGTASVESHCSAVHSRCTINFFLFYRLFSIMVTGNFQNFPSISSPFSRNFSVNKTTEKDVGFFGMVKIAVGGISSAGTCGPQAFHKVYITVYSAPRWTDQCVFLLHCLLFSPEDWQTILDQLEQGKINSHTWTSLGLPALEVRSSDSSLLLELIPITQGSSLLVSMA